jgi:hypothetical protein
LPIADAVAPADATTQVGNGITDLIIQLAVAHPLIASLLLLLGSLRFAVKPIMTGIRFYVHSTPSPADDALLDKVEHSWLWTGVLFCLDWLGSIKLPAKSKSDALNKALGVILLCSMLSAVCFFGTGCAGRSTAQVIRALSKDPASVHVRLTTIYGTIEIARTAPNTNSPAHTIGTDGAIEVK